MTAGHVELLGIDLGAVALFLLGLAAGVAILWGFAISGSAVKRSLRHRREERKQLTELSEKLEQVEAERRRDHDDDSPRI